MIKYDYKDYLFISSRIKAREGELLSRKTLREMAYTDSLSALYGMLEENGIIAERTRYGEKSFENALRKMLYNAYCDILKDVPSPRLFSYFTYPYDCNNLKAALKCAGSGESPDGILLPYGSVSVDNVISSVRSGDYSPFPENMRDAAKTVSERYAAFGKSQECDLILDRAVFKDVNRSLNENPLKFFKSVFTVKADTVNISSAIRILKSGGDVSLYERAFVDGGSLSVQLLSSVFKNGIGTLSKVLSETEGYSAFAEAFDKENADVSRIEKIGNSLTAELIKNASEFQGAETVSEYIAKTEAQVKNIRILIAGKRIPSDKNELYGRLCTEYV